MEETPIRTLTLVTGNPGKLAEARRIVASVSDIELRAEPVDLPEVQELDLEAVLREKGREAYRRLRRPVVVEETGLGLAALNGFPGPLVKWMLQAVGAEGIARTGFALGDLGAVARCALLYFDGETEVVGVGETPGVLVLPPRGDGGFGWDPIFAPADRFGVEVGGGTVGPLGSLAGKTYAELPPEIKDAVGHRGLAWRDLLRRL